MRNIILAIYIKKIIYNEEVNTNEVHAIELIIAIILLIFGFSQNFKMA